MKNHEIVVCVFYAAAALFYFYKKIRTSLTSLLEGKKKDDRRHKKYFFFFNSLFLFCWAFLFKDFSSVSRSFASSHFKGRLFLHLNLFCLYFFSLNRHFRVHTPAAPNQAWNRWGGGSKIKIDHFVANSSMKFLDDFLIVLMSIWFISFTLATEISTSHHRTRMRKIVVDREFRWHSNARIFRLFFHNFFLTSIVTTAAAFEFLFFLYFCFNFPICTFLPTFLSRFCSDLDATNSKSKLKNSQQFSPQNVFFLVSH